MSIDTEQGQVYTTMLAFMLFKHETNTLANSYYGYISTYNCFYRVDFD